MSVREEWQMACPQCGDDEKIEISATVTVLLTSSGADDVNGDRDWHGQSSCSCTACGFDGVVSDFEAQPDDKDLTAEQLDDKYNSNGDGEHPEYTREAWRDAVAQDHTIVGYWDWVVHQLEAED